MDNMWRHNIPTENTLQNSYHFSEVAAMVKEGCIWHLYIFRGKAFLFLKNADCSNMYPVLTQSKHIHKTETKKKLRPMTFNMDGVLSPSTIKMGFVCTAHQLLINWPLLRGYLGSWDTPQSSLMLWRNGHCRPGLN